MPRNVVFHPVARAEFRDAVAQYESERPGLGIAFAKQVRELVDLALAYPLIGSPCAVHGVRRLFTRDFPFSLAYLVEPDGLFVVAVAHGRREPEYWAERVVPHSGPG